MNRGGSLLIAGVLYGLFAAGAVVWNLLAGRPSPLFDPATATWRHAGLGMLAGLVLGLGVVWASRLMVARFDWARVLNQWFAGVLGPLSDREVATLALLSSVGEEMLFRGAMQRSLGLWITTAIFGLLHFPPRAVLWPWTLMATVFGLVFGLMARWSGDLGGAIVAHLVINLLNLRHVARLAASQVSVDSTLENLPGVDPAPSMDPDQAGPGTDEKQIDESGDGGRRAPDEPDHDGAGR